MGKGAVWEIRKTEIGSWELPEARSESVGSFFFSLIHSLDAALTFFLCIAHSSFIRRRNEIRRKPRAPRPLELVDFSRSLRVDDDAVEIVPLPSHLGPIALCGFECVCSHLVSSADARYVRRPMSSVYPVILELYVPGQTFLLFPLLTLQHALCLCWIDGNLSAWFILRKELRVLEKK